jgi:hypothetical protein
MMKELDPANRRAASISRDGYYLALFETLERLSKAQLIVCPHSPLHDHESVVDTRYEKIRAVFRQLSHGVSFRRPTTILHAQIMRAFEGWLSGRPPVVDLDRNFALTTEPDVWQDRYRIDLDFKFPDFAAALRAKNNVITNRLRELCQKWHNDPRFDFTDVFENKIAGGDRQILQQYARYSAHFTAGSLGLAPFDDEVCFAPAAAMLVLKMSAELLPTFPNMEERFARIREFFASQHFRTLSGVRISALFWATIAREINAGRKSNRFPKASMYNDIDAVALYSPFCDAMFVDKEISHLANLKELQQELSGKARLFSLRKNEKAEFLNYLRSIENEASPEHFRMVEEVYGPDWGSLFWICSLRKESAWEPNLI